MREFPAPSSLPSLQQLNPVHTRTLTPRSAPQRATRSHRIRLTAGRRSAFSHIITDIHPIAITERPHSGVATALNLPPPGGMTGTFILGQHILASPMGQRAPLQVQGIGAMIGHP